MPQTFTQEDWEKTITEIRGQSDRTVAIVAGALVETVLDHCIIARLLPMSNTHQETLFGDRGPLGTFSAKIELGFSLGFYGPKTHSDLHFIRRIRNQFAHYFSRDFGHPEIDKWCKPMTHYKPDDSDKWVTETRGLSPGQRLLNRQKFILAVAGIIGGMGKEASVTHQPPEPTVLT